MNQERRALLEVRKRRQEEFDRREFPSFRPETESMRNAEWLFAPIPEELRGRLAAELFLELTGGEFQEFLKTAAYSGFV